MELLKSQQRDLMAAIGDAGFGHAQFQLGPTRDLAGFEEFRVEVVGQPYFFTLAPTGSGEDREIFLEFSPGALFRSETEKAVTWVDCLKAFQRWLRLVRRELDAEGELLPMQAELPEVDADISTQLSDEERQGVNAELLAFAAEVGNRFDSLKAEVRDAKGEARDTAERLRAIEAQQARVLRELEYLREAASRVGKKDWSLLAIGTVVTASAGAALPPDLVRQFLESLLQRLGTVRLLHP